MEIKDTRLMLLANHLESIKGNDATEILSFIVSDLEVETVEHFLEIDQQFLGVADFSDREKIYADEDEAIEDGIDEHDICDIYKHSRNGLEQDGLDSYEAEVFSHMHSSLLEASKDNPEIKDWNLTELDEEKITNLIAMVEILDMKKFLASSLKDKNKKKISVKI